MDNPQTKTKKKSKGCLIAFLVVIAFICLVVALTKSFGTPDNNLKLSKTARTIKEACSVTDEEASAIENIFTSCEVLEIKKITHDDMLDDMYSQGDKGYRVQCSYANNVILYISAANKVISVRYADVDLYVNGVFKEKLTSFFLTSAQEVYLKSATQEYVKSVLNSPSTADFPWYDWQYSKNYKTKVVTVSSYVDAQNLFGAEIRNQFTLMYQPEGDTFTLIYFKIGDNVVLDNR